MKKQTHLTPDEVIELQNMGVEFNETADIWYKIGNRWDRRSREFQSELDSMRPDIEEGLGHKLSDDIILPAPSLQEVFDKLPNYINTRNDIVTTKILRMVDTGYYVCQYLSFSPIISYIHFLDENSLLAAKKLLIWVAKNYPETLK